MNSSPNRPSQARCAICGMVAYHCEHTLRDPSMVIDRSVEEIAEIESRPYGDPDYAPSVSQKETSVDHSTMGFLHRHPGLEQRLRDRQHVVVDLTEWIEARRLYYKMESPPPSQGRSRFEILKKST